jgi:hypothetical protein
MRAVKPKGEKRSQVATGDLGGESDEVLGAGGAVVVAVDPGAFDGVEGLRATVSGRAYRVSTPPW